MLIDVHSHYLPNALARALEGRADAPRIAHRDGGRFIEYGPGSGAPLSPAFTDVDEILTRMDGAGIDHAVLTVTIPGVDWLPPDEAEDVAMAANEETVEISRRFPERFSGLATVPLQDPERAVRVLRSAIAGGLKGAMIYSNVAGASLDAASRRVFFDDAAALDVPVMLHPTYPLCAPTVMVGGMMEMAGFLFDTTTAALRLVFDGVYERNPRLKFLVPHAGGFIPYFTGRIDMVAAARPGAGGGITVPPSEHIKRFYVDTVTASPRSVRFCCDFFGVDHVVHGTDHPFWPMETGPRLLGRLDLAGEELAMIEHRNAVRLFDLRAGAREL